MLTKVQQQESYCLSGNYDLVKLRQVVSIVYLQGRVVLGASVEDACQGPAEYTEALDTFTSHPFALTYRPETQRAYVLLKQGASGTDALCGAFHAHVLLHMIDAIDDKPALPITEVLPKMRPATIESVSPLSSPLTALREIDDHHRVLLNVTASKASMLYSTFVDQAAELGWQLQNTMLNPKEARLIVPQHA